MTMRGVPERIRSDSGPDLTAKVLIERWRCCYDAACPHNSLGLRPPRPRQLRRYGQWVPGLRLCACRHVWAGPNANIETGAIHGDGLKYSQER